MYVCHSGTEQRPAHRAACTDPRRSATRHGTGRDRAPGDRLGFRNCVGLGNTFPGEERTVEMELLPKEEGELGSVATVSISQASAKSRCTRPELALRLTAKPQVHVGQQQVVQIEISNPGSGDATGVMLLETIPTGVSHEAGPALEFEVGTLRPGENRRMELVLTAEQAGRSTT